MELDVCPWCKADDYTVHLVRGDLNLGLPGQFRLVRCNHCGLVYLNPRPTRQKLEALYAGDYDQYTVAPHKLSWLARLDRQYGLRKRCNAILKYKSSGRLLDVGCATGDFLGAMRDNAGWQVAGVELDARAAEYARSELGLDIFPGTLEEAGFADESFDVVTLWDVFEHVLDPLATLRELQRIMAAHGLLVIGTPNLGSLDARLFGPYWIGYELPRHLQVFSMDTLAPMLAESGFRVLARRCLYGSHASFMTSVRFVLRARLGRSVFEQGLEFMLHSRLVRLAAMPYFFLSDRLLSSGPMVVFAEKASAA